MTSQVWLNVYSYDQATLWISYGLAVGATALAVAGGIAALISNGASYSNKFSTILRVSRTVRLGAEVSEPDGDGRDPLPKYLKLARIDPGGKSDRASSTYGLLEAPSEWQSLVEERKASH